MKHNYGISRFATGRRLRPPLAVSLLTLAFISCLGVLSEPAPRQDSVSALLAGLIGAGSRTALAAPIVGAVTPLSLQEQDHMAALSRADSLTGERTREVSQANARMIRETIDYVNSAEFVESLNWTGPIPNIEPGMTFDEMVDANFASYERQLPELSAVELQILRNETVYWLSVLVDLEARAELGDDTVAPDELEYAFNRIVLFREAVILEMNRTLGAQLAAQAGLSAMRAEGETPATFTQTSILSALKNDIVGSLDGSAGFLADLEEDVQNAIYVRFFLMPDAYQSTLGCGCSLKAKRSPGSGNTRQPRFLSDSSQIVSTPHMVLLGDSRFASVEGVGGLTAYYGPNYLQAAVGGSTSDDLRDHFNRCGGGAYNVFYPSPPGFTLTPPPGVEYQPSTDHIQLENMTGLILTGGNNFEIYKRILQVMPFLIPLRINNALNGMNRVTSYFQAQGGNTVMLSQLPLPTVHYSAPLPILDAFARRANRVQHRNPDSPGQVRSDHEVTSGIAGLCATTGICFSHPDSFFYMTANLTDVAGLYYGMDILNAEGIFNNGADRLSTGLFKPWSRGRDNKVWLSNILFQLSAATPVFVSSVRRAGFIDLWWAMAEPREVAAGRYWAGNPVMYQPPTGFVGGFPYPGGDGVHPGAFGHAMMATVIRQYMQATGLEAPPENPLRTTGERCQILPTSVFPVGQPATWTDEPPPLPEVDDNTLILIGICLSTGHCQF